jgi:hypothetical protein
MSNCHNEVYEYKMKNTTTSIMIQKSDFYRSKHIRSLVLSTNVNDFDTGEPIIDGSIRKTLTNSTQLVDNPILFELNGVKLEENTVVQYPSS